MKPQEAFRNMVECGNIKENEKVLVVADKSLKKISEGLFASLQEKNINSTMIFLEDGGAELDEPPKSVSGIMKKADLVYFVTSRIMLLTKASIDALGNGTRIIGMDGISERMLKGGLLADYKKVDEATSKIFHFIEDKKEVFVRSKNGTNLKIRIKMWLKEGGVVRTAGDYAELPGGEIFSTVEDAEGTLIIDSDKNAIITIKNGKIASIKGDEELEKYLSAENGKLVAEFGIGTNAFVNFTGEVLEEEKKLGTVHIAFGNNILFGGNISSPIHYDFVIKHPDLYINDELIIENGKFKKKI